MQRSTSKARRSGKGDSEPPAVEGEDGQGEAPVPKSFWAGTLSFGLVSIPVELVRATRSSGIALRMLSEDGTPLSRRFVCPEDGTEVSNDELVRGYERRPGEYVQVSDEELEALEPEKSRDIDLRRFVPKDSINPIYFDRPFFLAPSGASNKAYRLLASVMERGERVGIATFVMHDREHVVAILARDGLLHAEILRFRAEVRSADDVGLPAKMKVSKESVQSFIKLIEEHSDDAVDLAMLEDETLKRTHALLEEKRKKGRDLVQSSAGDAESFEPAQAEIIDLMEILKKSLQKDGAGSSNSARTSSKMRGSGGSAARHRSQ